MKEATGELSMTVITIVAIVAIAGVIWWLSPRVSKYINDQWGNLTKKTGYVEVVDSDINV